MNEDYIEQRSNVTSPTVKMSPSRSDHYPPPIKLSRQSSHLNSESLQMQQSIKSSYASSPSKIINQSSSLSKKDESYIQKQTSLKQQQRQPLSSKSSQRQEVSLSYQSSQSQQKAVSASDEMVSINISEQSELAAREGKNKQTEAYDIARTRRMSKMNTILRSKLLKQKDFGDWKPELLTVEHIGSLFTHTNRKKRILVELYGIFEYHGKTYHFDTKSLFIFTQHNPLRKATVWLTEWKWFKNTILLCILFNSVCMAMENYESRIDKDYQKSNLDNFVLKTSAVFALIFIAEFMLKVIAMGFFLHKKSYMRDVWNIIDFLIVMISCLELVQSDNDETSFTLMRTLRLLKPLRSFKALKTLRFLIASLIHSLAGLLNVFLFLGFVFSIFAVLGVNLFSGNQYRACRLTPDIVTQEDGSNSVWPQVDEFGMLCHSDYQCQLAYDDDTLVCGSTWEKAGLDPVLVDNVRDNEAIFFGISGFDNFGQALYTVFQVCTLESWIYLMYNFAQANENSYMSYIFFPCIIVFGGFFTMNLILAQILDSFNHQKTIQKAKMREQEEKDRITREFEAQERLNKSLAAQAATSVVKNLQSSFLPKPKPVSFIQPEDADKQDGNQAQSSSQVFSANAKKRQSVLVTSGRRRKSFLQKAQVRKANSLLIELDDFKEEQKVEELKLPNIFEKEQNKTRLTGEVIDEEIIEHSLEEQEQLKEPKDDDGSSIVFFEGGSSASGEESKDPEPVIQVLDDEDGQSKKSQVSVKDENGSEPQLVFQEIDNNHTQMFGQTDHLDKSSSSVASDQSMISETNVNIPIIHRDFSEKENIDAGSPPLQSQATNKSTVSTTQDLLEDHALKNKCFETCQRIVKSAQFNIFMFFLILGNTITMSRYRFDQSDHERQVIFYCECFFDLVFFVELVLKVCGFGLTVYLRDKWNRFDAMIVIVSILDYLILLTALNVSGVNAVFSFLKLLRLSRMLKIARFFRGMRVMLKKIVKSLKEIGPFTGLLLLFIYLFALLGSELFAYKTIIDEDGNMLYGEKMKSFIAEGREIRYPRINFNTFIESVTTVFILVNGEDWIQVAQEWIIAYGEGSRSSEIVATIYFIVVMLIGHLTLFALFTGILLHTFQQYQLQVDAEINLTKDNFRLDVQTTVQEKAKQLISKCFKAFRDQDETADQDFLTKSLSQDFSKKDDKQIRKSFVITQGEKKAEMDEMNQKPPSELMKESQQKLDYSTNLIHYDLNSLRANKEKNSIKQLLEVSVVLNGQSLNLFTPSNKFRKFCSKISQHAVFQIMVIIMILVTTIMSAFDSPLVDPNSERQKTLEVINNVITMLFTLEAILKTVTLGFVSNGPTSYLQSPWNCLDFFVVILSIIDFIAQAAGSVSAIKTLRVARLLRPIRLVAQNSGLKTAIVSLVKSIPKIMELLSLVSLVIFMFAILNTYLFSGAFYYCFTEHIGMTELMSQKLIKTKFDCLNYGGEWINPQLNFNHIGVAMLGLSSIQSHEGWLGMMWSSVDAQGVDMAPVYNANLFFIPFTLLTIFVICLLFLNLFVGVVIETFNHQKEILTNNHVLTNSQRIYLQTQLLTFTVGPKVVYLGEAKNWLTKTCRTISSSQKFEMFILTCILLNTCVLGAVHYKMSNEMDIVLEDLNLAFMAIFALEATIKIIAMSTGYFKDAWNQFDFAIIILAVVIMIPIKFGYLEQYQGLTTAIRVLRVARMLRLFVKARKLQIIFQTLVEAGPTLFSLGFLLLLSIYMFAVIGVQLFALLDLRERPGIDSELNKDSNFQYFFSAFITLLRCATGENWNQIMFECAKGHDILYQCNQDEDFKSIIEDGRDPASWSGPRGCGSFAGSILFHLVFQIIITQIFLNLFIAIIVDSFMGVTELFELPISRVAVHEFEDIWSKQFDPQGTGYINVQDLPDLLYVLSKGSYAKTLLMIPLYIRDSPLYREKVAQNLDIPTFQNHKKVTFYDTLQKLVLRVVRLHNVKQAMIENAYKIKVMERLMGKSAHLVLEKLELLNMRTDYQTAFDEMLKNLDGMSGEVELIRQLRTKTHRLRKMYNHLVDTNVKLQPELALAKKINHTRNLDDLMIMIYTTKHYFAGIIIARYWNHFTSRRRIQREIEDALMDQQSAPESIESSVNFKSNQDSEPFQSQQNEDSEEQNRSVQVVHQKIGQIPAS